MMAAAALKKTKIRQLSCSLSNNLVPGMKCPLPLHSSDISVLTFRETMRLHATCHAYLPPTNSDTLKRDSISQASKGIIVLGPNETIGHWVFIHLDLLHMFEQFLDKLQLREESWKHQLLGSSLRSRQKPRRGSATFGDTCLPPTGLRYVSGGQRQFLKILMERMQGGR
jgi:hypothetical protein